MDKKIYTNCANIALYEGDRNPENINCLAMCINNAI